MRIEALPLDLRTRDPFVLSRGGGSEFKNLLCRVEADGIVGVGEAAPSAYHGEDRDGARTALAAMARTVQHLDPFRVGPILRAADEATRGASRAARCALDVALHDWVGKAVGQPIHRLLGLDPADAPRTSFTIALGEVDEVRERARRARGYPILKVKLGRGAEDDAILEAVASQGAEVVRVDANAGWTAPEAAGKIRRYAEQYPLDLVEQPLPEGQETELAAVIPDPPVPVFLDESVRVSRDVPRCAAGAVQGVNVKLAKCGGLRGALAVIATARAHGLLVMLGCMIESSVGVTAMSQLAPLADFVDLDGHLLLESDPFRGLRVDSGRLVLPEGPGLGVEET
jgi:L-alanine-DL-glutamate epimerase-like enolase superfamily enzyme